MKKIALLVVCFVLMMSVQAIAKQEQLMSVSWTTCDQEPCIEKVVRVEKQYFVMSQEFIIWWLLSLVILTIAACFLYAIYNSYKEEITRGKDYDDFVISMADRGYQQIPYPGSEEWYWQRSETTQEK